MQPDYFAYVASAYGFSALALIGLGLWIWREAHVQRARLAALEEAGITRRAANPAEPGEAGR